MVVVSGNCFVTANILRHNIIKVYHIEVAFSNIDCSFKKRTTLHIISYSHSTDNEAGRSDLVRNWVIYIIGTHVC